MTARDRGEWAAPRSPALRTATTSGPRPERRGAARCARRSAASTPSSSHPPGVLPRGAAGRGGVQPLRDELVYQYVKTPGLTIADLKNAAAAVHAHVAAWGDEHAVTDT
jgi:hypothetical protein